MTTEASDIKDIIAGWQRVDRLLQTTHSAETVFQVIRELRDKYNGGSNEQSIKVH